MIKVLKILKKTTIMLHIEQSVSAVVFTNAYSCVKGPLLMFKLMN